MRSSFAGSLPKTRLGTSGPVYRLNRVVIRYMLIRLLPKGRLARFCDEKAASRIAVVAAIVEQPALLQRHCRGMARKVELSEVLAVIGFAARLCTVRSPMKGKNFALRFG